MMIAPARRSTPTKALELIHNLQLLDLYLHNQSLQAFNRHKTCYELDWKGKNPTHQHLQGHLLFWTDLNHKLVKGLEPSDCITDKETPQHYKVTIHDTLGRNRPKLSQYNIFTDGSKTTQGTGAGYVIMKGKSQLLLTNSINLRKNASIFQAEATAIQAAAESLTEIINPKIKFIRIFSDSQAVLKALDKDTIKSQTILNLSLIHI